VVAAAGAVYAGWQLWRHYEIEPWTRDGRVKAYVVQVAPDVTGQVTKVYVHDNQQVKAGDRCSTSTAPASNWPCARRSPGDGGQAALAQAQRENARNTQLDDLVAQETREQGQTRSDQARAALAQAVVNRDTAR
jgi:multidrug resistance efflux pump